MDAIRLARGATGRNRIVKVEGGYHGHHDEVMISMKPPLELAGPADAPNSVPGTEGIAPTSSPPPSSSRTTTSTPSSGCCAAGDIACFIVEPVMENIGICLPDEGYLQAVRDLTTRATARLLIFDEVKTGITAGYGGATGHFGIEPDLVTLAKSIGGGFPIGRVRRQAGVHGPDHRRPRPPPRYVQRQPAGDGRGPGDARRGVRPARRPMRRSPATAGSSRRARRSSTTPTCRPTRSSSEPRAASRGAGERVRNYRDYRRGPSSLAFAQWIHGINRGILLPPGLDEQWLISVMHDEAAAMRYAEVFAEFAAELTS